jgi:hypothetical protein
MVHPPAYVCKQGMEILLPLDVSVFERMTQVAITGILHLRTIAYISHSDTAGARLTHQLIDTITMILLTRHAFTTLS